MTKSLYLLSSFFSYIFFFLPILSISQPLAPLLNHLERSDWINVKTDISPAAVGDGVTDDTPALQAALNLMNINGNTPKIIYLPPGNYRITQTLNFPASVGANLIGHGRTSIITWDGVVNGTMLLSKGAAYGQFIGINWNGNNKNVTIISHNAPLTGGKFEASVQHRFCTFRNANMAIQGGFGGSSVYAASEMEIENCLFVNCTLGINFQYYNYYNEYIHNCEFWNCGTGIYSSLGNIYVEQCHFQQSTLADIRVGDIHNSAVRRCSSYGSKQFLFRHNVGRVTLQDCNVSNWTDTDAAVYDLFYTGGLIFDCNFSNPPSLKAPFKTHGEQTNLIYSENKSPQTTQVVNTVDFANWAVPIFTVIGPGQLTNSVTSAHQSFLQENIPVPTKIFDAVTQFGAIPNDNIDDTNAAQAAINAARNWGNGAIAYFPSGKYRISQTLQVYGSNYYVGGTGYHSEFQWIGANNSVVFRIENPWHIVMENLGVHAHLVPLTTTAFHQTSSNNAPSFIKYDNLFSPRNVPSFTVVDKKGLRLTNLPSQTSVYIKRLDGGIWVEDCGEATIIGGFANIPPLIVNGANRPKTGFLGFLTLNGGNGVNVQVSDNQNLIIANLYSEQSGNWGQYGSNYNTISLSGSNSLAPGRVTIGGSRMLIMDTDRAATIQNYKGTFSYAHPSFSFPGKNDPYFRHSHTIKHTGTAPIDLVMLNLKNSSNSMIFDYTSDSLRLMQLECNDRTRLSSSWISRTATRETSAVALSLTDSVATKFDGINDCLVAPFNEDYYTQTAFSMGAWVKREVGGNGWVMSIAPPDNPDYWLSAALEVGNNARFLVRNKANATTYPTAYSTTPILPNVWYWIVGTWDGDSARIYVNNGAAESTTWADFAALQSGYATRPMIGGIKSHFFKGSIDEPFFAKSVFSQNLIDSLYNNGVGMPIPANKIFSAWHLGEKRNAYAADFSGKGATAVYYEYNVNHNPSNWQTLAANAFDDFRALGNRLMLLTPTSTSPLPLNEVNFKATLTENCHALLTWEMQENPNLHYFEIEKADSQENVFKTSAKISPKNTLHYEFLDSVFYGKESYFRLKMNYLDGTFAYSPTLMLATKCNPTLYFTVFPNPSEQNENLQIAWKDAREMDNVQIVALNGNIVQKYALEGNRRDFTLNISHLAAGSYWIVLQDVWGNRSALQWSKSY